MELKSFDTLKKALTTSSVLAYPNFNKPFLVTADELKAVFVSIQLQLDENGREQVTQ